MRRALPLAFACLLALPAAAEAPPALIEATEAASRVCTALGGAPAILDGYQSVRDLNGDGADDFVTDMARLECQDAWSAFCGSSGCPVTTWLSRPDGGHDRFDLGRLLSHEILEGEPLPALVARYAAIYCGESLDDCTRTWIFKSNAPEEPPIDARPGAEPAAPAPEPDTPPSPPAEAEAAAPGDAAARPLAGWSLRRVPGGSPVALGMGAGGIATLAAFCLEGQPFLAVTLHEPPGHPEVALRFDFSQGPVEVTAGAEATAGGAFVVPLAEGPLALRLAGRDTEVQVSLDGAEQGVLSLAGSTRSLRGALADCHGI